MGEIASTPQYSVAGAPSVLNEWKLPLLLAIYGNPNEHNPITISIQMPPRNFSRL